MKREKGKAPYVHYHKNYGKAIISSPNWVDGDTLRGEKRSAKSSRRLKRSIYYSRKKDQFNNSIDSFNSRHPGRARAASVRVAMFLLVIFLIVGVVSAPISFGLTFPEFAVNAMSSLGNSGRSLMKLSSVFGGLGFGFFKKMTVLDYDVPMAFRNLSPSLMRFYLMLGNEIQEYPPEWDIKNFSAIKQYLEIFAFAPSIYDYSSADDSYFVPTSDGKYKIPYSFIARFFLECYIDGFDYQLVANEVCYDLFRQYKIPVSITSSKSFAFYFLLYGRGKSSPDYEAWRSSHALYLEYSYYMMFYSIFKDFKIGDKLIDECASFYNLQFVSSTVFLYVYEWIEPDKKRYGNKEDGSDPFYWYRPVKPSLPVPEWGENNA